MNKFYPLKILEITKETENAYSITFDVPKEWSDIFNYKPGQYITLKFILNNEEVRRSYSICSSPMLNEPIRIGVKRVKEGLVSNHINDNLKVGDTVEVMPPDGRFFAEIKENNYKTYYLFAAGSGITPILSITKTILSTEKQSYVHMVYGNQNSDTIMFLESLKLLQKEYPDRFILIHTLSRPKSSWSDLWKTSKDIPYRKGRIDSDCVTWFINEYPPYAQNAEYFICGPDTMIENTKKTLNKIDVPDTRIFTESFGSSSNIDSTEGIKNAKLTARLQGEMVVTTIPKGKTILRALIDSGKEPPYSCEGGVCATCICKLTSGQVHMKNNLALDEQEVAQGYILSCQSIPITKEIEVIYEKK
ncbi:ferredoxin--NADP reductase [Aquimarina sp. 2201CG5-10]|uniref:ferredoxin--NADP reductase n=1 Tax=Aquimarina callyspongiae TaxID=3098150 RepID=UPI002AB4A2F5|nr:ferredoxin--NADP reductase [Aquimarina sp. 2201CG5-10]MDY8137993.1 ferredoxin--NADP reductase [Aquimarina sp. 2201CG5-10]